MSTVVETFRDLLLLRRGPQDLPHAPRLLIALVGAYIVAQAFAQTLPAPIPLGESFVSVALATLLILAALRLALRVRALDNRFVQAGTALIGCNLAFALINLPVALGFGRLPLDGGRLDPAQVTPIQMMLSPLILALGIWQLVVAANILRHSLNLSLAAGIGLILGWFVLLSLLLSLIAGPQGV